MDPIAAAIAISMSSQASASSSAIAKKQAVSSVVIPFDVETSKAAEQRALSEEGIITATATAADDLLPRPRRCCDCICNSCLCRGIIFGGNPCCGMRTASIVCNVIALCWTVIYVVSSMLTWEENSDSYLVFFCGSDDDDETPMSPKEQDECASVASIKFTFYLEMALSYAGLLCLVMAIVGNAKYQWKLAVPLLILRVLAFSIWFDPLWKFMCDGSNVYLLFLSYPNWKFVSEVRKGILTRPATSGGHQSLPTEENFGHAVV